MINQRQQEYNKQYYLKNKEKFKRVRAKWYKANKKRAIANGKKYYLRTRKKTSEIRSKWNKEIRQKILDKLGNRCIKCSFKDIRALQIDHVNGGGVKEIKTIGRTKKYYQMILDDTKNKYQILCANCNWIKRHENHEFRKFRV